MGEFKPERLKIVKDAFRYLDNDHAGELEFDYIKSQYIPHNHPDVLTGKKGDDEVFQEFLSTFETHRYLMYGTDHSRPVTLDEWIQYYHNISANIDNDAYFKSILNNVWNMDGKAFKYKVTSKVGLFSQNAILFRRHHLSNQFR